MKPLLVTTLIWGVKKALAVTLSFHKNRKSSMGKGVFFTFLGHTEPKKKNRVPFSKKRLIRHNMFYIFFFYPSYFLSNGANYYPRFAKKIQKNKFKSTGNKFDSLNLLPL